MGIKLNYNDDALMIVLSGPSGVGKGTLKNLYMNEFSDNTYFSVSATTRSPRLGEADGIDYLFVSKDKFEEMIEEDDFLEYAAVHSDYYGTPKNKALEELKKGNDVIFDIDVQGGLIIKSKCPDVIMIFVAPPDTETLEHRLRKRGTETEDKIAKRLSNAVKELDYMDKYDYVILNDKLEDAYNKLKAIIAAEKSKSNKIKKTAL